MRFQSRSDLEKVARAGTLVIPVDNRPDLVVTRQLSNFYLVCRENDEGISNHLKFDGYWEPWVSLWMTRNLSRGNICVDIGANYGYYSFLMEALGCRVTSYEADPELCGIVSISKKMNGSDILVNNFAITDGSSDTVTLNIVNRSMNSTIKEINPDFLKESREVNTKCINDFGYADFIKIDIEGAELMAWEGGKKYLCGNPNCRVLLEWVYGHYDKRGEAWLSKINQTHNTRYIDYQGNLQPFDQPFLSSDTEDLRMVLLESKWR
jgi:FkbM family methyltransferase